MRLLMLCLSLLLLSTLSFAGGDEPSEKKQKEKAIQYDSACYKVTKAEEGDCPTLPPPATPPKVKAKKEECPEKKETPKPKPKKKKPKPKKVVKKCPKCKTCKPKIKVVNYTKTKYIEKLVDKKHSLDILTGIGPHGFVTDYYETKERSSDALRKEKDKSVGGLLGLYYQYRFSSTYHVGVLGISNETIMASGGIQW